GILAEKLQDGVACPVCGSLEHPKLAALSNDVPSQEKLKNAKKDSNNARAEREAFSKKAEGERMALEELKSSLNQATKKILNIDVSMLSKNNIIEKKEYILESYYSTEENIKKEKLTQRRKEEIEKNIPQIENEVKSLEQECTDLNILLEKNLALLLEKENQLSLQKKELSFPNKKEAEDECERLRTLSKILQKKYEDAHTMLNLHDKKIGELSAKKEALEKNILSNENINLEEEKEKRNNLEQKQNACNEQAKKIAASLKMNTNIYENILRQSKEITEKEKKFQWITALAKTANGKLAEKEKIKLESYVQSTYFDRIINKANLRFMKMTEGQFELTRQKVAQNKQSDFFLNLDVIDHYNGSTRSIKSLSGGESFMASLSLALGLSDEIQSSSGGIQIDCLFVDEGFGSLDPNTLDCAYKALVSLSEGNKLVGLISHVQDLKERIDKQVIVTKTKSGGSSARISI
ncbi:MAG: hypothetical protein IJR49_00135, partial [Treponema sp.]|nr:hypothetical protein [Treponema sp.]